MGQINSGNKFYLKSLVVVDEEDENKFKSMRDFVSQNDVENENDLFYLSQ